MQKARCVERYCVLLYPMGSDYQSQKEKHKLLQEEFLKAREKSVKRRTEDKGSRTVDQALQARSQARLVTGRSRGQTCKIRKA